LVERTKIKFEISYLCEGFKDFVDDGHSLIMDKITKKTLAVICLLVISGVYAFAILWMLKISLLDGELQNILSTTIWFIALLWCAKCLSQNSERARKWAFGLLTFHALGAFLLVVFSLDMESMPSAFKPALILVFVVSVVGAIFAKLAEKELVSNASN
jgi:peptidoglycan/LPS O-acetylase OafA/YrhL